MMLTFFGALNLTKMSRVQTGSKKSYDRGRGRNKRSHDSNAADNDDVSPSRYQRTITDEEKRDFVTYQKG